MAGGEISSQPNGGEENNDQWVRKEASLRCLHVTTGPNDSTDNRAPECTDPIRMNLRAFALCNVSRSQEEEEEKPRIDAMD